MDKKKILIVDDEVQLVEMVKMRLEANNYDVITAHDGDEAIEKARLSPDLILLDVMMPKSDGFEVAKKLKANSKTQPIPIIMFTARSESEATKKALDAGAYDYIVKPFNPVVLLNKVKDALKK
ncbi:MAG: response regulator transcription factor [Candidatus Omnitrophota bacterium]